VSADGQLFCIAASARTIWIGKATSYGTWQCHLAANDGTFVYGGILSGSPLAPLGGISKANCQICVDAGAPAKTPRRLIHAAMAIGIALEISCRVPLELEPCEFVVIALAY
jgi:hypothetical protein